VPAVATAHEAVLNDDAPALRLALDDISEVLRTVSRGSLTLIDSRSRSATHVDPVVWAKTVAPLAVPFGQGVLGPSGTASPIFNLLDVFLGRRSHESQLGREMALHRRSYPVHWRGPPVNPRRARPRCRVAGRGCRPTAAAARTTRGAPSRGSRRGPSRCPC
jgi:hypothetical protein